MKITTKLTALLLALCLVTLAAAVSAVAEAPAAAPAEKASFSIRTEDMLRYQANMDTRAWDEQAAWQKEVGLQNALTEEDLRLENPAVKILTRDGRIYMIDGAQALGEVKTPMDAYRAVYRLTNLLGAAQGADLRLWSQITAPGGQTVYVFQQVYEGLTVVASTVRIVTGADGKAAAVFSSLSSGMPESTGVTEITAEQAEEAVRAYLAGQGFEDSVMPEYTSRAIVPFSPTEEDDDSEIHPDSLVWLVYSRNPAFSDTRTVDLPYLAHCVEMDGAYLREFAVAVPGDTSAQSGYTAEYAFEFMEKGEWSGTVKGHDDTSMDITVPVMRDTRTGVWYLGDPERKIVMGEFAALAYDDQVQLVSSPENAGWPDKDLITYYNLIRAWDFYAETGWFGPDGVGTSVLLLRGLCLENGEPFDNAAYVGKVLGWECFAYGGQYCFGQALDIFCHEFTHGVTGTLMNTNLYLNDYGAINEAMSDIMGNICERMAGEDDNWLLGENSGEAVRSMLDPHRFGQPEYVWDLYYGPHTDAPNGLNDRGGVHSNSSLLNLIAAGLCEKNGMTLEDARRFWLTAASAMTPEMDYPQLSEVLLWAADASGCGAYRDALAALIADTRITTADLPEEISGERRLVRLTLPETGDAADDHWVLMAYQLDLPAIQAKLGELSGLLFSAWRAVWGGPEDKAAFEADLAAFRESWKLDQVLEDMNNGDQGALDVLLGNVIGGTLTQHTTWRGAGSREAVMVVKDLPTLYVMFNVDDDTMGMRGAAVLLGTRWYDLNSLVELVSSGDEQAINTWMDEHLTPLVDDVVSMIGTFTGENTERDPAMNMSNVIDLPTAGLETLTLSDPLPAAEETAEQTTEETTQETTQETTGETAGETAEETAEPAPVQ